MKGLPNLPHSRVDAVIDITKNAFAPDAVQDFLARDQLPGTLQKQQQEFHRNALNRHGPAGAAQFESASIHLEAFKTKHVHHDASWSWIGTKALEIDAQPRIAQVPENAKIIDTRNLQEIYTRSPLCPALTAERVDAAGISCCTCTSEGNKP